MTSEVSICNLALSHLGDEATVASIDPPEGSAQAEHCATFYPIARNEVLEEYAWGFAQRRQALSVLAAETPPDSYAFVYAYPNTCLRPLKLLPPGATDDDDTEDFIVESLATGVRVIYANTEDAILSFTALVTDTTKYSTKLQVAISRLLASYLAGPVIKGDAGMSIAAKQLEFYEKVALPKAKSMDANARKKQLGNTYENFVPSGLKAAGYRTLSPTSQSAADLA